RRAESHCLGTPHVCQRHEPIAWWSLCVDDSADHCPLSHSGSLLDRQFVGSTNSIHNADDVCARLYIVICYRWTRGLLPWFSVGRHTASQHLFRSRPLPSDHGGVAVVCCICGCLLLVPSDVWPDDE